MARQPKPVRVLVVDDDAMVRELLAVMLEAEGYSVDHAGSGDAALDLLRQSPAPPQVVLADVQMPGIAGAELARYLRRACGPRTLLLAMSGSGPPSKQISQYDGFLLKPFTAQQLAEALSSSRRSSRKTAAPTSLKKPRARRVFAGSPAPGTLASVFASAPQSASNNGMETLLQPAQPAQTATAGAVIASAPDVESPAAPALNEKIYRQLAASMPAPQLREMYAMCLNDARQRIAAMRTLARTSDCIRLSREAHAIKGGSGMLGATEMYTLAAQLEAETRSSTQTVSFSAVNSLDELSTACDRLERILGSRA
ncbi:MAG: response regulator [Acidobacteriaceae bacterium]|jgi:CheY-like chemotaxis protein